MSLLTFFIIWAAIGWISAGILTYMDWLRGLPVMLSDFTLGIGVVGTIFGPVLILVVVYAISQEISERDKWPRDRVITVMLTKLLLEGKKKSDD